jgi:hypothetical protein
MVNVTGSRDLLQKRVQNGILLNPIQMAKISILVNAVLKKFMMEKEIVFHNDALEVVKNVW